MKRSYIKYLVKLEDRSTYYNGNINSIFRRTVVSMAVRETVVYTSEKNNVINAPLSSQFNLFCVTDYLW